MQLTLFDEKSGFDKTYFLDVFAEVEIDDAKENYRLKTIEGQGVPDNLSVRINRRFISKFPKGTIYKVDTKLVRTKGKKPYFVAIKGKDISRAIEFFDYNYKIQYGFDKNFVG